MTTCCPYRQISYASWRYLTFQRLLAASGYPPISQPISRHTVARDNCCRQASRSLGTGAESTRRERRVGEAQKCLYPNHDQDDDTKVAASESDPGRALQPEQVPQIDGEKISHVSNHVSLGSQEDGCTGDQGNGATTAEEKGNQNKALKRRLKRRQWSPHDEQGKDDLKSLAASLKGTSEPSERPIHDVTGAPAQDKISGRLPVSPLVEALEHKKATKSPPRGGKKEGLANNPWATMLASPMRLCSATGVRLPKDLLVPWGLVRKPATEEVYFMPTELAELDFLKDRRRSLEPSALSSAKRPKGRGICPSNPETGSYALKIQGGATLNGDESKVEFPLNHHQKNHTEAGRRHVDSTMASQASKSSSLPRSSPVVYILPFLPLLHHLTHRFTSLQKDMLTRQSKPNAINRLLPWRLKANIDHAKFYAEQRVNALPPATLKEPAKAPSPVSLQQVKWEVDIDVVMLRILRERLLAALEMLGNRNQKLWRRKCELVKAIRAIRTSHATTEEGAWRLLRDARPHRVRDWIRRKTRCRRRNDLPSG